MNGLPRRAFAALTFALLIPGALAAPGRADESWTDVRLSMEASRYATAAAFDPETERILVVMGDPFQTNVQLAAYEPGEADPVWRRTFAASREGEGFPASYAGALLVMPARHRVYVGGGHISGSGSGPFESAGYVYAFDTRTGENLWRQVDPVERGMAAGYDHLAPAPDGSVIAVTSELVGQPDNRSGSYAAEVVSLDGAGREQWRWADSRVAYVRDTAVTNAGLFVFIGETYVDDWARPYRVALDASDGSPRWRHAMSDGTQHLIAISPGPTGRSLYLAGIDSHETGGQAMMRALSASTGRFTWKRLHGAPVGDPGTGERIYDGAGQVVATRSGPCFAGSHVRQRADFSLVLPDDGFVACYSPRGRLRWIDESTGAPDRLLRVAGGRLLWAGRQERSRGESSEETLRFAVRSLSDGVVHAASSFEYRGPNYDASDPLLAFEHEGAVHFVNAMADERREDGSIIGDPWLLDRVLR
ncbi:MAG TPA: PQQ-binding-like beta-propeller repeat protein [Actinomycetota bacterium]|nr:PQQ-binding-like beta-propeller repeat protein [Actinomycetota bacterium]